MPHAGNIADGTHIMCHVLQLLNASRTAIIRPWQWAWQRPLEALALLKYYMPGAIHFKEKLPQPTE